MILFNLSSRFKATLFIVTISFFNHLSHTQQRWFENARNGVTKEISKAINSGQNVNSRHKKTKNTALMLAVINNHIDLVKLLLDNNADTNITNKKQNNTALIYAVSQDKVNKDIINLLMQYGADPNIKNKNKKNALDIAKERKEQDIVNLLQQRLLEPPAYTPHEDLPSYNSDDETEPSLEPPAYDTPDYSPEQDQKLFTAIEKNNLLEVKKLLNDGAQVNTYNTNGSTPLMLAFEKGNPNIVRTLLDNNANPYAKDKYNRTALVYAKSKDVVAVLNNWLEKEFTHFKTSTQTLNNLLENNKLSDIQSILSSYHPDEMNLILFYAARNGYSKLVDLLLKQAHTKKPSIDYAHPLYGDTPLLAAIKENHLGTVKLLLRYDASVYTKDKEKNTPLSIAQKNNNEQMVKILKEQIRSIEEEIHDSRFE